MSDDPRDRAWTVVPDLNAANAKAAVSVSLGGRRLHCVPTGADGWWVALDRCPDCDRDGLQADPGAARLCCGGCGRRLDPAAEPLPGLPYMCVDDELYVLMDDS